MGWGGLGENERGPYRHVDKGGRTRQVLGGVSGVGWTEEGGEMAED